MIWLVAKPFWLRFGADFALIYCIPIICSILIDPEILIITAHPSLILMDFCLS